MAITLLASSPSPPTVNADWVLMQAQLTACKQLLNTKSLILTAWDADTVPSLAEGTYIQHLGSIYIIDTSDEAIATGALANGQVYIAVTGAVGAATLTAAWIASLSGYAWDAENNGMYNGTSQLLPYSVTYNASLVTYTKHRILNMDTANVNNFILIDRDGDIEVTRDIRVGGDLSVAGDVTTVGDVTGLSFKQTTLAAGTSVLLDDATEYSKPGSGYIEKFARVIPSNGTIRISHDLKASSGTAYSKIFKNGVEVDSFSTASTSYVTDTYDLTVSEGDRVSIQIAGNGTTAYAYIDNIKFLADRISYGLEKAIFNIVQ